MPIQSQTLGPGTLTLGAGGTLLDASCQVTAFSVVPSENVEEGDDIPVLCGEVLEGDEDVTIDWVISGTFLQDVQVAGIIAWTWTNAKTSQPFTFVPNTATGRKVTGTIKSVVPLQLGGEVTKPKNRPTSDFEWRVTGTPVLANVV